MLDTPRIRIEHRRRRRRRTSAAAAVVLMGSALAFGGCALGMLFGGMADAYEQSATHAVPAKYPGLDAKSFAVVISADRIIQADQPDAVPRLTVMISDRLKECVNATGWVPGQRVLEFQYSNTRWPAMTMEELAKALGVERLVFIDVQEFRLNDPGNPYLWSGVASVLVGVVEADGVAPSEFTFQEAVRVVFPDKEGIGPEQLPRQAIQAMLVRRLVDRVSWLFYEHDEMMRPEY